MMVKLHGNHYLWIVLSQEVVDLMIVALDAAERLAVEFVVVAAAAANFLALIEEASCLKTFFR